VVQFGCGSERAAHLLLVGVSRYAENASRPFQFVHEPLSLGVEDPSVGRLGYSLRTLRCGFEVGHRRRLVRPGDTEDLGSETGDVWLGPVVRSLGVQRCGMARLEDHDLLIGAASFVADIAADGCLHAHFVRSTDAHATIQSVDVGAALTEPGVVAVHTSATIGLGPHVHLAMFAPEMNRFALADGTVRHVGEAVAVVVATTSPAAEDAAEHVLVELEPLNPVLDARTALEARPIYPAAATNLVHEIAAERPDPIVDATNVVDVMIANQRLASAPIETDGIVATPTDGGIDVWCTTQGVHSYRDDLASALDLDPSQVRVRAPAVGGAFGGRVSLPVEFVVVAKVAIMLGRPVRWHQSRFENLTAMAQGRDISSRIRLGYDDDGTLTGLDVDAVADAGATAHAAASLLVSVRRQAAGLYRVPEQAFRWRGRGALTNTPPVGAYRGAGQPEANHARERAIDIVALRLEVDPVDLRLRNLFSSDDFPLTAAGGVGYDSGDPPAALVRAVELIELEHWRGEQLVRRERGSANEIGIGVACYAQTSGRGTPAESVLVRIADTGRVLVASGSPSHGQGHRTTWSNLVSQRLGVETFEVDVVDADTAAIDTGLTTGGSRTSQVLAGAIADACDDLVEIARPLAAAELEAADEDIVVVAAGHGLDAGLAVRGVPTSRVTWGKIAAMHAAGCIEVSRDDAALGSAHPRLGCRRRHRHRPRSPPSSCCGRRLWSGARAKDRRGPTTRWFGGGYCSGTLGVHVVR